MQKMKALYMKSSLFLFRHHKLLFLMCLLPLTVVQAFAADSMWTVASKIIKDVYAQIAAISTALAGAMTAVAVVGAKMSNNQHKADQAWDWMKRIWVAWAVINGIGAFLAWIKPWFDGLNTID
jgi:hypothetical protein